MTRLGGKVHKNSLRFLEIGVQSSVSKSGVEQEPGQDTEELHRELMGRENYSILGSRR